jgi:hypothetical protein
VASRTENSAHSDSDSVMEVLATTPEGVTISAVCGPGWNAIANGWGLGRRFGLAMGLGEEWAGCCNGLYTLVLKLEAKLYAIQVRDDQRRE